MPPAPGSDPWAVSVRLGSDNRSWATTYGADRRAALGPPRLVRDSTKLEEEMALLRLEEMHAGPKQDGWGKRSLTKADRAEAAARRDSTGTAPQGSYDFSNMSRSQLKSVTDKLHERFRQLPKRDGAGGKRKKKKKEKK